MSVYVIIALFVILDILSGVAKAMYKGSLQSKVMREGLWHKFSYVLILALAYLVDYSADYVGSSITPNTFTMSSVFICTTETVSIVENCLEILPDNVGKKIREIFHTEDNENDS